MKGARSWVSGIALLAVIGLIVIAPGVHAQPSANFHFQMPFDADWSRMALSTGDYSFSLDQYSANGLIFVYHDNKAVGITHAESFDAKEDKSDKTELVLVRHDGKVSVRALRMPGVGTFYFTLPKELSNVAAKQPRLLETITVDVRTN
jgi:hypothetical protein